MKTLIILFLVIVSTTKIFSQVNEIRMFPHSNPNITNAKLVRISSSQIMLTFIRGDSLYSSLSTDNGVSWNVPRFINNIQSVQSYSVRRTNSGRIIIVWTRGMGLNRIFSDNNGTTWSTPQQIGGTLIFFFNVIPTQSIDNTLWLCCSRQGNLFYIKSTDNGNTWSEAITFSSTSSRTNLSITSFSSNRLMAIYQDNSSGNEDIFYSISNDGEVS